MTHCMLHTRVCEILNVEYPICLAGMASHSGPTLAAAVSNSGGLGVIGVTFLTPEETRHFIRKCRSLTEKPFGVNLLLPEKLPEKISELEGDVDWHSQIPPSHWELVETLMKEFDIPEPKRLKRDWGTLRREFTLKQIDAIMEEKVSVFVSGLGNPKWMIARAHDQGMKVMALVGNVKNAVKVKQSGVDIVVAQGTEGGGHTGRVGTMVLIPQVADAIRPTPVLAAGGIADGRGLAAALALGADGVWVGTAFLATPEATVDHIGLRHTSESAQKYKHKLIESTSEDTRITRSMSGKTARVINNKLIDLWEKRGYPILPMPLQGILTDKLMCGTTEAAMDDFFPVFAGQVCGMIKEVKPAQKVIEDMVAEAAELLSTGLRQHIAVSNSGHRQKT